jgi:hypothetical protein
MVIFRCCLQVKMLFCEIFVLFDCFFPLSWRHIHPFTSFSWPFHHFLLLGLCVSCVASTQPAASSGVTIGAHFRLPVTSIHPLLHPSLPPKDKQLPPAAAAMMQPPTKWWRNAIWLVPSQQQCHRPPCLLSPRGFDPVAENGRGRGGRSSLELAK